jgi:hypothetical protein
MAIINYTVNIDSPNSIPGVEQISQQDLQLVNTFEINSAFDSKQHTVELHITDLAGNILVSDYNYIRYKLLGNAQSADTQGAKVITVDPVEDIKFYGFETGGVKLLYHLYNNPYSENRNRVDFFIDSISPDRTELLIDSLAIPKEVVENTTRELRQKLQSKSYFDDLRLNFLNNDLLIITNIDYITVNGDGKVAVKLYEPLPNIYAEKDTLTVAELVGDSFAFEVLATITLDQQPTPTLREANFNIELTDSTVPPSPYLNYNELFSYNVGSNTNELYSLINQQGIELSIDHSDYKNFIHFSSAEERLLNFVYKLELIEEYSADIIALEQGTTQTTAGSLQYYRGLLEGILRNFDHYERFLYYESGSNTWPKTSSEKPYTNVGVNSPEGILWFSQQRAVAYSYDKSNLASLENTIPNYLRDDESNRNYVIFTSMIGQHFDTLWLYAKEVTSKYDADNRLERGISKDLVEEALRNFGVQIYNSSKSTEDLFTSLLSQEYNPGNEVITDYITGSLVASNTPIRSTSFDNYQKEVYKRIYHNLSYLVKTKGTERGVRALINCFGIPSDILKIKLYGGRNVQDLPSLGDFQYFTSSLDKIRLDNTGSITGGSTLSKYTSTLRSGNNYTDDLHNVEIGFSPTTDTDNFIIQNLPLDFNLNQILGDPRNSYKNSYEGLNDIVVPIVSQLNTFGIKDYVRLLKFFDNVIFKLVKDFLPARTNVDTGLIIKPHILHRNKAKEVKLSVQENINTGSIDTAFISGSSGRSFGSRDQYLTSYTETLQTPLGLATSIYHTFEEAKYDGELSRSIIKVSNGELGEDNPYTIRTPQSFNGLFNVWQNANDICILFTQSLNQGPLVQKDGNIYYTRPGSVGIDNFFTGTGNSLYKIITPLTTQSVEFPHFFTSSLTPTLGTFTSSFNQYDSFLVSASKQATGGNCENFVSGVFGACEIGLGNNIPSSLGLNTNYNVKQWIVTSSINTLSEVFIYRRTGSAETFSVIDEFNGVSPSTSSLETLYLSSSIYSNGDQIQVVLIDTGLGNTCRVDITRSILLCLLDIRDPYKIEPYNAYTTDSSSLYLENPLAPSTDPESEKKGLASFFVGIDSKNPEPFTEYTIGYTRGKAISISVLGTITANNTGSLSIPGSLVGEFQTVEWNYNTAGDDGGYIANLENIFNTTLFPDTNTSGLTLYIYASNTLACSTGASAVRVYGSNPDSPEEPPAPPPPPTGPNIFIVQKGFPEDFQEIGVQYNSIYSIGQNVTLSGIHTGCWTIVAEALAAFPPDVTITGTCL